MGNLYYVAVLEPNMVTLYEAGKTLEEAKHKKWQVENYIEPFKKKYQYKIVKVPNAGNLPRELHFNIKETIKEQLKQMMEQKSKSIYLQDGIRRIPSMIDYKKDFKIEHGIIPLSEKEAREIFRRYSPTLWGIDALGYEIYPIKPNEALYLKTKGKRFHSAYLLRLYHTKGGWKRHLGVE